MVKSLYTLRLSGGYNDLLNSEYPFLSYVWVTLVFIPLTPCNLILIFLDLRKNYFHLDDN